MGEAWRFEMDPTVQKAHFFRRASFGATLAELDNPQTPRDLLDQWLNDPTPTVEVPQLDPITRGRPKDLSPQERQQAMQALRSQTMEFGEWIMNQSITAANPLHERITTFWRDHFVVSMTKFNLPAFMADYEQRLRTYALGDFQDLLWHVTTSPAMLLYLDNQQNQAGKINENYSRELLELFTVGRGHYTEADIESGARALTGWTIHPHRFRNDGEVEARFVRFRHDPSEKTYLGYQGNFKTEDIVEILANHPATAEHLSTKLWSEFAYPDPDPDLVQDLANVYLTQGRNIADVIDAIFSHPEFYSDRAYRSRLKQPYVFMIGSIRQLQLEFEPIKVLQSLRAMQQIPYRAPSVKGWPDDTGWINSASLLNRINLAQQMVQDYGDEGGFVFNPDLYSPSDLIRLLVDDQPPDLLEAQIQNLPIRGATALILASPTYQLA